MKTCVASVASLTEEMAARSVAYRTLMEQQTVTNSAVIHGLYAMTFQSAMHWSLRRAPTMINHLISFITQLELAS